MRDNINNLINKQLGKKQLFSIDNFRVFDTRNNFQLAPITILTGPNNSGKSSLVKALLMMKNGNNEVSYEFSLPNRNLDLPKASDLLHKNDQLFTFEFSFNYLKLDFDVQISLTQEELNNPNLYFYSIQISNNNKVVLHLDDFIQNLNPKSMLDMEFWVSFLKVEFNSLKLKKNFNTEQIELFEIVHEDLMLGEVSDDVKMTFDEILKSLMSEFKSFKITDIDATLAEILEHEIHLIIAANKDPRTTTFNSLFENRIALILNRHLHFELVKRVEEQIPGHFKIRKTEFYRHFENFSEDFPKLISFELSKLTDIEVLPISKSKQSRFFQKDESSNSFLAEAAIHFYKSGHSEFNKYSEFKKWMGTWLKRFDIGSSLQINNIDGTEIYTIELVDENNKNRNLRDLGFGVSQVITLLLSPYKSEFVLDEFQTDLQGEICVDKNFIFDKQPLFYLEEPESNLHPNWQSLLIELIIDINQRFGIRFIIETHSEYMIRKIQTMIARSECKEDDVTIYYFNSHQERIQNNLNTTTEIRINKNGTLSQSFGSGFFDEAGRLSLELLSLNTISKN